MSGFIHKHQLDRRFPRPRLVGFGNGVGEFFSMPPLLAFHAESLSTGPAIIDSKQ